MARQGKVWTPSVDVLWYGEVPDTSWVDFERAIGRPFNEDMRDGLRSAIRNYSLLLNHEYQAAPLSEQKKALIDASKKSDALLESLQHLETQELGYAVSGLISEEWERNTNRQAEFERMERRAAEAMAATFTGWGLSAEQADEVAWAFVRDWRANLLLRAPTLGPDFMEHLFEARQALGLARSRLDSDGALTKDGDAFAELVGQLFEWSDANYLQLKSYPNNEYGNHGRMTALVKEIVRLVPEVTDDNGRLAPRQMRPENASDATWAERILTAKGRYEARSPTST